MIPEWAKDLGIMVIIVGLVGKLVWAFIIEKTKHKSAGDQTPTWSEIHAWCGEKRDKLTKECEKEMGHVVELIKKDLERGQERFQRMEGVLAGYVNSVSQLSTDHVAAVAKLTTTVEALQKKVENLGNNGKP